MSKIDRRRVAAGQTSGGCEIRTREGLPPTRFPTMLASVHRRPSPSVACANTIRVTASERCLCVPITSSTSCDQPIFVDHATYVSVFSNAVQVEIDWLG